MVKVPLIQRVLEMLQDFHYRGPLKAHHHRTVAMANNRNQKALHPVSLMFFLLRKTFLYQTQKTKIFLRS